jgi:hypothetical protein
MNNVFSLFKKKWFWIALVSYILFLLIVLMIELTLGSIVAVKSLTSGKWHQTILIFGGIYVVSYIGTHFQKGKSDLKNSTRMLWFVTLLLSWKYHGFLQGLYFVAIITFFSRVIKIITSWLLKKFTPRDITQVK